MKEKVWLISDTHLNHDKMVELCGRPKNHTELILKRWKNAVGPNDLTIHLGDVIFNRPSELKGMIDSVPGRKVLVMGNHDHETPQWYMRRGFAFACEALVFKNILFTHIPAQTLPEGITMNIHGHLHNNNHHEFDVAVHPFNHLFALELTDYKPILLEKFLDDWVK